jgi:hypothetical protein
MTAIFQTNETTRLIFIQAQAKSRYKNKDYQITIQVIITADAVQLVFVIQNL